MADAHCRSLRGDYIKMVSVTTGKTQGYYAKFGSSSGMGHYVWNGKRYSFQKHSMAQGYVVLHSCVYWGFRNIEGREPHINDWKPKGEVAPPKDVLIGEPGGGVIQPKPGGYVPAPGEGGGYIYNPEGGLSAAEVISEIAGVVVEEPDPVIPKEPPINVEKPIDIPIKPEVTILPDIGKEIIGDPISGGVKPDAAPYVAPGAVLTAQKIVWAPIIAAVGALVFIWMLIRRRGR